MPPVRTKRKTFGSTLVGGLLKSEPIGLVSSYLKFKDVLGKYKTPATVPTPTTATNPTPENTNTQTTTAPTPENTNTPIQNTSSVRATDNKNSQSLDEILMKVQAGLDTVNNKEKTTPTDNKNKNEIDIDAELEAIAQNSIDSIDKADTILENSKLMASNTAQLTITRIQEKFAKRIEEMQKTNDMAYRTAKQVGYRSGRARYAPIMQAQILTGEEEAGIKRISDLQAEEESLIMQAENARDSADFESLNSYLDMVDNIGKEKEKAVKDLYARVNDAEKMAMDRAKEERQKVKDEISIASSLAEKIAPAFAEKLGGLKTEEDKMAFAEKLAEQYGISNPAILLGELEDSLMGRKKDQASINNTYSLINNRGNTGDGGNEDFSGEAGIDSAVGGSNTNTPTESLEINNTRAKRLERNGVSSGDLIALQNNLNRGFTLEEVLAQADGLSAKAIKLLKSYIKKVK